MYIKKILIRNIKTIESLDIEFPIVKFKCEDSPVIKEGLKLSGNNFIGKTTILQCINHALGNQIGANLDICNCVRKGCTEGSFEVHLYDEKGSEYTVGYSFNLDQHTKELATCITPSGIIQGKRAIQRLFKYNYISANKIIELSNSADGRIKLMRYFLLSLSEDTRAAYLKLEDEEGKAYKDRTPLNIKQKELKTVYEQGGLTMEEAQILLNEEKVKSEHTEVKNKVSSILSSQGAYEEKLKDIGVYKTKISNLAKIQEETLFKIEELDKQIDEAQNKDTKINNLYEGELDNFKTKLDLEKINDIKNINLLKSLIQDYLDLLNSINDKASQEVQDLKERRDELQAMHNTNKPTIEEMRNRIKSVEEALPKTMPEEEMPPLREREEKLEKVIERITELKYKQELYEKNKAAWEKAYKEWEEINNTVNKCREGKKEIIRDNNIEVEGFEFTPEGVKLKGYNFSESNISGADRRIAALQFTMAMNNVVKLGILEEMESLDESQEQHVLKFASDRGFMLISDNVLKESTEKLEVNTIKIL